MLTANSCNLIAELEAGCKMCLGAWRVLVGTEHSGLVSFVFFLS